MNTKKLHILCSLLLGISGAFITSCDNDFLDKQSDDMLSMDQVFANRLETERYLRNVYDYLPNEGMEFANLTGVSDEADVVFSQAPSSKINTGNWSPTSIPFDDFGHLYRGIRSASVFVTRVEECQECEAYTPGSTLVWKAEARALRAWYYFLLMRKYGPAVVMEEILPVDAEASATQIPRNSYDECVDYMISELDEAMSFLPDKIINSQEYGRTDKRTVLAMKSRILLYAASPLWNGNSDYEGFRNPDGKKLVNTSYDANKWGRAADAAKELIDMMPGGLYKKNDGNGNFDPFLSYRDLFFDRWNQEVIWARPGNGIGDWEKHTAPRQLNGYNGNAVTQGQVDAYHMANGKQIGEVGSNYVENGFSASATSYTNAGDWNMYVGREPRFYASVLYNGDIWPFLGNGAVKVQMYATGLSGKNGSHDYSPTGYLITKFSSPQTDVVNGKHALQAIIFFRLGEIYLNYAEALNEFDPGNPDIEYYVNLVRERAGIADLPTGLTQDEMRERIHHERRVELAFESHRVFDTRRWKIAEETDGGSMWGMDVSKGTSFTDAEFYQRTVFETRVFTKKHYLWPIPQSEIDRNTQMTQNPGW